MKQRIRESFNRAANSYDSAASIQRRICERLLAAHELCLAPSPDILDAGCGTGYGTRLMQKKWPGARISAVDFAPTMLEIAREEPGHYLAADIEKLPFAESSFDLWWSSLAIQWCDNALVFAEAARLLRRGGSIAFSTLGTETFAEIRSAFARIDEHRHTLSFTTDETLKAMLMDSGFKHIVLFREQHFAHYPDLKSLLRSVKNIGAQNVGSGGRSGMLGRHAWQKVEAAYEQYRQADGLPARYDVILAYATK